MRVERIVSVRVEVVVSVEDPVDLEEVRQDLASRARGALEDSPRHRDTLHASSVLRRPHPS